MNLHSQLSLSRLSRARQNRFNPLSSIADPTQVARKLDSFEAGYLKDAVNIFEALEQREDLIRAVVSKRKKAVGREGWTVLIDSTLPESQHSEAQQHAAALEYFYRNLRCENALDRSEKGGFKLLCRQMMDAIGKRFAVHEIIWNLECAGTTALSPQRDTSRPCPSPSPHPTAPQPDSTPDGEPRTSNFLSATFRFVPLGFFENTTGQLRYLDSETAVTGLDLEPGAWMVTVGDGLMIATATAWILKNMVLNDWLAYSDKNGRPGLRALTGATPDSPEWKALETTLHNILEGSAVVHSSTDDIKVIDLAAGGHIPFPELVDRIDRMIAALWRGADLSTISRDRGYGASLQEKETCALEEDDAEMLTETLNEFVDKWVIRYLFGPDVKPLARVKVLVTAKECTTADLQIDEFLYKAGAPLSLQDLMHRYGRAMPKPGEEILQAKRGEAVLQASPAEAVVQHDNVGPVPSTLECARHVAAFPQHDTSCPSLPPKSALPPHPRSSRGDETHNSSVQCQMNNAQCKMLNEAASVTSVPSCSEKTCATPSRFTLLQPDWLQLSPYGDFPHARGLQRVDRTAADLMVTQFNSFRARLGRLFGGAPFYVGHPDLPSAHQLADNKAYGWVMQLEARADGLYGQVKWSEAGLDLLKNAHYKYLSPYWEGKQIGTENGKPVFRPVAFLSVGLTNTPNIPVRPLANSSHHSRRRREEAHDNPAAPLTPFPPVENTVASTSAKAAAPSGVSPEIHDRSSRREEAHESQCKMEDPQCSLLNENPSSVPPVPLVVEQPHRVPLQNLHTRSITENIACRRAELIPLHNRRQLIHNALQAKLHRGLEYNEAWRQVKKEHHDWFANDFGVR